MTESEYSSTFSHITREWLQTETSEIGNLLRGEGAQTLRQLKAYIQRPGLMTAAITDDEGYERSLSTDQWYEVLNGVFSYMNNLQSQWGPTM